MLDQATDLALADRRPSRLTMRFSPVLLPRSGSGNRASAVFPSAEVDRTFSLGDAMAAIDPSCAVPTIVRTFGSMATSPASALRITRYSDLNIPTGSIRDCSYRWIAAASSAAAAIVTLRSASIPCFRPLHAIEQRLDIPHRHHPQRQPERARRHPPQRMSPAARQSPRGSRSPAVAAPPNNPTRRTVPRSRSTTATTAKNYASIASSRSRTVCACTSSACVRTLLTRSSGRARPPPATPKPAPSDRRARPRSGASRFGWNAPAESLPQWHGYCGLVRANSGRAHRAPRRSRTAVAARKPLAQRIHAREEFLRECFIHHGRCLVRLEAPSAHERNLHRVQPPGPTPK